MPAFSWLALFFGAFYFVYGAYLPFWSLWLEGGGVSAEMIGLLLG
ncbi:3-phenylpropionate MFS transporter, partial [Aeromonas veronii bv. sobria]